MACNELKQKLEHPLWVSLRLLAYLKTLYGICLFLGASCVLWTGCWASQLDDMVVMASPALNGYHSVVSYSWVVNGYTCIGEDTPILYATRVGLYSCHVLSDHLKINMSSNFVVQSKPSEFLMTYSNNITHHQYNFMRPHSPLFAILYSSCTGLGW